MKYLLAKRSPLPKQKLLAAVLNGCRMKIFNYGLILLLSLSGLTINVKGSEAGTEIHKKKSDQIPVVDEIWLKNKIKNRNGKILFVNFWATWCEPCVEEFPDLVKIYNKNKNSSFEFLSVSVNLPSEIESKVKPFLKEQAADFPVVVTEEKRSEEIINMINPDWDGTVPATIIYDENGNRKEFFAEPESYEVFNKSIEKVKNIK
jgi:thiol-disulfide isomerase/thioredoxin